MGRRTRRAADLHRFASQAAVAHGGRTDAMAGDRSTIVSEGGSRYTDPLATHLTYAVERAGTGDN